MFTISQVLKFVPYKNISSTYKALTKLWQFSTFHSQPSLVTMLTDKEIPIEDMMMHFFAKTSKPPWVNVFIPNCYKDLCDLANLSVKLLVVM